MKTVLLKIAAAAAGITLALCIAIGSLWWYESRPKPPKPWNVSALVASDTPGFGVNSGKEPSISLHYSVRNMTAFDYSIERPESLRVTVLAEDDTLSQPLEGNFIVVNGPIFIPAHQTGSISLTLEGIIPVAQTAAQSNDEYHEQVRQLLNEAIKGTKEFEVFDEVNHYQIKLRRWAATKPPAKKP